MNDSDTSEPQPMEVDDNADTKINLVVTVTTCPVMTLRQYVLKPRRRICATTWSNSTRCP